MPFIEWKNGQQVLASTQSHWFDFELDGEDGRILVTAPYTTQYGTGTPPWTATLTTFGIDPSGTVTSTAAPVATNATGFNFQTADVGLTDGLTAVFWTSANGTYPASGAVDLNARVVDANNNPVGPSGVLLSGITNLYQFRVASAAFGGSQVVVTYSTYDATSHAEQIHYQVFGSNGTPVAGESGLLDSFTTNGYTAYGFGTLTTSTGTTPSFIHLRGVDSNGTPNLLYQTITTTGVTGAFTTIPLDYSAGSVNRQLVDWNWERLDAPSATGNNLLTVAVLSDVTASGTAEHLLDIRAMKADGGQGSHDVIALAQTASNITETRLANGGFVVGYTDAGVAYLRAYDNAGDVVGGGSSALPHIPASFKLDTMPDGRIVAAYAVNGGTSLDYDIYTVPTGPTAYVADTGVTRSGLSLVSGDSLTVRAGGTAVGTQAALGVGINILSGGATSGTVLNGGTEQVFGGGSTKGTIVNAIGSQAVVTGSVATGTIVNQNGQQSTAGTTRDTILNNGAYQFAGQAATDYTATLNAGSNQWLSGQAFGTLIKGGDQLVQAGGAVSGAIVTSGEQEVTSGAKATGTTVNGGFQYVDGGATASLTTVNGGTVQISALGAVQGLTVNAGGTVQLFGDGNTIAASGATGFADNGGTLVKKTSNGTGSSLITANVTQTGSKAGTIEVASGTLELGGTLTGTLLLKADAGTTLILDKAASAGASVAFTGANAVVQLGDAPNFRGSIAGFASGETLDLRSILDTTAHAPALSYRGTGSTGSLVVSDGTHSATLAMTGSYTQAAFHVAADAHGGTLLTYG